MSTHQATYETALERFGRQQLVATIGAVGVGVAILGVFMALVTLFPQQQQPSQPIIIQNTPVPAGVPAQVPAIPVQSAPLPDAAAAEPSASGAEKQPDG